MTGGGVVSAWLSERERAAVIDGAVSRLQGGLVVHDPSTGGPMGVVGAATADDITSAVAGAARAFPEWAATPPLDRGTTLHTLAETIRARRSQLAELGTRESGKPLAQSLRDVDAAEQQFRFFGGLADKVDGRQLPGPPHLHSFTRREPVGVTAHITPWNFPLSIPARSVAAALALGNTAVVKPSEIAPFSALLLGEIALEAGLPPGVLNVLSGAGGVAGAALVEQPAVRAVAFTGGVETGRRVGGVAGRRLIRASLELGGKAPNIVFADADLDRACRGVVYGIVRNAGQSCLAGSRLLVQRSVYDEFVGRVAGRLGEISVGPGLDDPDMGPLVSARQLEIVSEYVAMGRAHGRLLQGGERLHLDGEHSSGWYFAPTLFAGIPHDARLAQEEVFGPVLCALPFADETEVVRMANDVPYGLAAGLWTRDGDRSLRMVRDLAVGSVFVNGYPLLPHHAPHGGYKNSGIGREKGIDAIDNYTEIKHVSIAIAEGD